jgi:hypothetical protein
VLERRKDPPVVSAPRDHEMEPLQHGIVEKARFFDGITQKFRTGSCSMGETSACSSKVAGVSCGAIDCGDLTAYLAGGRAAYS